MTFHVSRHSIFDLFFFFLQRRPFESNTHKSMASLQQITDAMAIAVEQDGTIRKKFPTNVQFNVDGETYTLQVMENGPVDLQVRTSIDTLRDLLEKKISPQQAFMKGKLKIKGKMALAMKLSLVLDATRKQMALQTSRL